MAACASGLLVGSVAVVQPVPSLSRLAIFALLVAVASGAEAALAPPIANAPVATGAAGRLAQANGLVLLAIWLGGPLLARAPTADGRALLGAVAIGAGGTLRAAAIARLGARFNSDNTIAPGAALETRGVFRRLAHPSELGLLLLAAGAAVFWGGAATALMIAPLYLLAVARLSLEEAALARRHGARYAAYRRSTFDPFPILTPQGAAGA
jgi:protein-S-isoprenylcysteine O-methyltransferase Ste14